MEIKTTRSRDAGNARAVPPAAAARTARRKAARKAGKNRVAGRRAVSALRIAAKIGGFAAIVAFLASIFVYAYTSEKFNLRQVTFYGCKELDRKELESIIRRDFPANVLRIDLERLKERLERETWARRVEIRRVLPSDLVVIVEERTPSVVLEMDGGLMIADAEGILLGRFDPRFGKLDVPVFKGVLGEDAESYVLYQEENAARVRQGLAMLSEIESGLPDSTKKISEVDLSDRKNLKIFLVDDTAEVYLGERNYLKRFRALMDNMDEYRKLKDQYSVFVSIDMRYENQIVYLPGRARME